MQTAIQREPGQVNLPADLSRWRSAISRGNQAFQGDDPALAIQHYNLALTLAENVFGDIDDADAGVAAWVIAHHNLADAWARLGRYTEHRHHLCAAHEKLCEAMNDDTLSPDWRLAALQHSRRTYAELTRFARHHPEDARVRAVAQLGAAGPTGSYTVQ